MHVLLYKQKYVIRDLVSKNESLKQELEGLTGADQSRDALQEMGDAFEEEGGKQESEPATIISAQEYLERTPFEGEQMNEVLDQGCKCKNGKGPIFSPPKNSGAMGLSTLAPVATMAMVALLGFFA